MEKLRKKLNEIDSKIVSLFNERLDIVKSIGEYKGKHNFPITDKEREKEILDRIGNDSQSEFSGYLKILYQTIFEISKGYETKFISSDTTLIKKINENPLDKTFSEITFVACQGEEGEQITTVAKKMFKSAGFKYFDSAEKVCLAVDKGESRYGILECPLNGAYFKIFDLIESGFYIVRSAKCLKKVKGQEDKNLKFVCLSKDMELYHEANKIVIRLEISDNIGSLFKTLSRFAIMGYNITNIISREISGKQFVYINFDGNVFNDSTLSFLAWLQGECEVEFLGNYLEI